MVDSIPYPKRPKTLPIIFSRDGVKAFIMATNRLKQRAISATLSSS